MYAVLGAASVSESAEHGPMIGFFPDATFTDQRFDVHSGDRILLYTDGLIEARNGAGEFFDMARTRQLLAGSKSEDARTFGEAALNELARWTGGGFEDDVTFVVVQVR